MIAHINESTAEQGGPDRDGSTPDDTPTEEQEVNNQGRTGCRRRSEDAGEWDQIEVQEGAGNINFQRNIVKIRFATFGSEEWLEDQSREKRRRPPSRNAPMRDTIAAVLMPLLVCPPRGHRIGRS